MKFLNILILLIFIHFIYNTTNSKNPSKKTYTKFRQIAGDETTTPATTDPATTDPAATDSTLCMEYDKEDASPDVCKTLNKNNNENNCCFFSFVDGPKRIKRCIEIKKDKNEILQYINSLESNKLGETEKFDDVSIDCFSNFVKCNFKLFSCLLFILINI